jgi:hypothetical protein
VPAVPVLSLDPEQPPTTSARLNPASAAFMNMFERIMLIFPR